MRVKRNSPLRAGLGGAAREGIGFEHVRGGELAVLQPGLSPRFMAGTFVPRWQTVSDPYEFARRLPGWVRAGGTVRRADVAASLRSDGVTLKLADGRGEARDAVIAAGAWSRRSRAASATRAA